MARRISKSKLERSDSKALKNSQNFNDMKKSTSSIHKAKDQFTKSPKSPDINKSLKITSSDHLR